MTTKVFFENRGIFRFWKWRGKMEHTKKLAEVDKILTEKNENTYYITYAEYKKHKIEIDTETINDIKKGEDAYFFELAFQYFNKQDQEMKTTSLINSDTFYNKEQMSTCWCKNKIKDYLKILRPDTKKGLKKKYLEYKDNFKLYPNKVLCFHFNTILKDNDILYFSAFNAKFDYRAIFHNFVETKTSIRLLKKLQIVDTRVICIRMLYDFPKQLKKYKKMCKKEMLYTDKGNCKTDVLTFGIFFWGRKYVEEHIALFDTIDESKLIDEVNKVYEENHKKLMIEVNNVMGNGITYKPLKIDNI